MWSKGYQVTGAELRELHSAMDRHDGLFYLAAGADFVADHKARGDVVDLYVLRSVALKPPATEACQANLQARRHFVFR